MLIPAHVGIPLSLYFGYSVIVEKRTPSIKQLLIVSFVSLIPDIVDKTIHLLFPVYPDHAIFHSYFIFFMLGIVLIVIKKWNLLFIPILLSIHSSLDMVSTAPGALIYPLRGFVDRAHHFAPIGNKIIHRLPEVFAVRGFKGHYVAFEVIGIFLILAVAFMSIYYHTRKRYRDF